MERGRRLLGAVAVAGPVVFTVTWVVLGWSHPGYRPRQETISSLSAHDVPAWGWMVAGQLALALASSRSHCCCRAGSGAAGLVPAAFAALAAYGTVQASAFRTICNHSDAGWCTPLPRSAYPRSQWLHGTGTGLAFGGVLVACLTTAVVAWRLGPPLRDVAVVSTVAVAVVAPARRVVPAQRREQLARLRREGLPARPHRLDRLVRCPDGARRPAPLGATAGCLGWRS